MQDETKNSVRIREIGLILVAFAISRILSGLFGIHFKYDAINFYWQYLDVETLKHNLLVGVWYDHAQPPCFNLLLGMVVKLFGSQAPVAFAAIFKAISLIDVLLLYSILKKLMPSGRIPIILSLLYLLSPALLIFETELFYTTFISMLLLISLLYLLRIQMGGKKSNIWGVSIPLAILCLTRSMYHIGWLILLAIIICWYYRKDPAVKTVAFGLGFAILLVLGWYIKNYKVFGKFSTSTWIGMNLARTVFHDHPQKDSTQIEALEPFSHISKYKPFIDPATKQRFAGLNDRDLLQGNKNGNYYNENHIDYIEVSDKYMAVSKEYIKAHPGNYLKNVVQSCIMFFAPSTIYVFSQPEAKKIKWYDVLYSGNLTHFARGQLQRNIMLTVSAIPYILIYTWVMLVVGLSIVKNRKIALITFVILTTIAFVFGISSFIEHYENMRFRYEIQPLFLVLLGRVLFEAVRTKKVFPTITV